MITIVSMPTRLLIGANISHARISKGMSAIDLARALGVDRNTINNWEVGLRSPKADVIPELSSILGVSIGWLFRGCRSERRNEVGA